MGTLLIVLLVLQTVSRLPSEFWHEHPELHNLMVEVANEVKMLHSS